MLVYKVARSRRGGTGVGGEGRGGGRRRCCVLLTCTIGGMLVAFQTDREDRQDSGSLQWHPKPTETSRDHTYRVPEKEKPLNLGTLATIDPALMGNREEIVTLQNAFPCDCHNPKSSICTTGPVSNDQRGYNYEVGRSVSTWFLTIKPTPLSSPSDRASPSFTITKQIMDFI